MPDMPRAGWRDIVRLNLLLTLALVASGWLAQCISPSPGYIAPLYPPAGIALAALLVFGWRLSPAVYLAAAIAPLLSQPPAHLGLVDLWLAMFSAIGVLLQGLVAAALMRRLRIWPGGLDTPRHVLLLICVVAPACSLISATLSIPVMLASASLSEGAIVFNWSNWWVGDTLGIVLFTPITLAVIGKSVPDWRGRWRSLALPLLICSVVIGGVMAFVRQHEDSRFASEFQRTAEHFSGNLVSRLNSQTDMLDSVVRFVMVKRKLEINDWTDFATPWLQRFPGTLNLTWNPRVAHGEREAFEASMRALGLTHFYIKDRDQTGAVFPAAEAREYLPITFVEPLEGNARAVGVNVLSLSGSKAAIQRSQRTGDASATGPIRLVQAPGSQQAVAVYQIVPDPNGIQDAPVRGVVSMALQLDKVVQAEMEDIDLRDISVCLFDRTGGGNALLAGPGDCNSDAWLRNHLVLGKAFAFTDRSWYVLLRNDVSTQLAARSWLTGASLVVSLVFSGMLSAFLLLITGRARRVEEQVAQRTAELASATAQLREQKASLAQAQRIARMGSWEIVSGSPHLHCSDEFRRLLNLPGSGRILLDDVLIRLTLDDRGGLASLIQEAALAPLSTTLDCSTLPGQEGQQVLHFQIESEWMMGRLLRIHGTVQNVTQVREAEAHIQFLARFDALTGLPNRNHWQDLARAALNAARRHGDQAAVLFLDLDHFKTINDSLGHTTGDELLANVASRLRTGLRAEDILARQGGDEFVLLLPRLRGFEDVSAVAAKLVQCMAAPITLHGHELTISVSIGIAYYPGDGEDIDTLLKHADVAMYSAKQAGRNNFQFFVPEMNQRAVARLQMESALRRAIEKGELVLHFQPQMDLASGRIEACEALVRWQHPEMGLIPPMDFIPLAEETGLILPMGDWILREACRQQVEWARHGLPLVMAINISALQFKQADFTQKVARIIAETGVKPQHVELEITESALLGSTEALVSSLEALRSAGVRLALDDFGTGYSCLSYLKRLPIERLKIDRSFVKDLPGDAEDAAIASATLSMARDLGMAVVAEGVENEAQKAFLVARGCQSIQGYLISRPQAARDLEPWLTRRNAEAASVDQ